jgi:hypothetical protein
MSLGKNFLGLITGTIVFTQFLLSLIAYIPLFIIIVLVNLWIKGAMIDQAKFYPRRRPLNKSFEYSTSRYFTILAAAILFTFINFVVSQPPYIGYLLSFVVSLMFFYLYPAIIIDKKDCIESFKRSFNVFVNFPLETFVTWLLVVVISFIVLGIFLLPLLLYFAVGFVSVFQLMKPTLDRTLITTKVIPMIGQMIRSPYIIPLILIFAVGLAFVSVFMIGTQSRLYINFKKREV